ncbi:hypothetical protein HYT58_02525, partial [Candidatus Woesearchaeota archaeon]|nr:hypothetical protein [Candidatus Woesearchaeota archaeon]
KRLNTAGRFDEQDELGLPIFNQDGKRGFYVREDGLSRLGLGGDLGSYAHWDVLAGSDAAGRVVVCGEAALDKKVKILLDKRISELETEKARLMAEISQRYEAALRQLKGN